MKKTWRVGERKAKIRLRQFHIEMSHWSKGYPYLGIMAAAVAIRPTMLPCHQNLTQDLEGVKKS